MIEKTHLTAHVIDESCNQHVNTSNLAPSDKIIMLKRATILKTYLPYTAPYKTNAGMAGAWDSGTDPGKWGTSAVIPVAPLSLRH
jgi:hypothetical protein